MTQTDPRRWWALGGLTLSVLAVGLDGTVLSVALPTLAKALHASESDLQWFSSGYLLVLAAAMLPLGLLGDRYGRKKVMLGSLALFGAGSAACAYSTTVGEFIAARIVLGIAGAGIIVMALSSLTVLFSEEERPKAVGVWAAANFVALPIGPILGGWLLTSYWWGWVFLLNVPVALLGLTATALLVPPSRAEHPPGLDPIGVVLSVGGLVGVTYGLIEAGQRGWGNIVAWLLIIGGLAIIVAFFAWERSVNRRPNGQPLVDLALFRSKAYLWGVVLAAVAILAMFGVLFTLPQYFQGVLGTTAMGSGIRLLPLIGGLLVGALPASVIAKLIGTKLTVAFGFAAIGVGLLIGTATSLSSGTGFVATWMAICGFGLGIALSTTSATALAELSQDQAGVGSAVLQALNKVGGPLGSAVLGSVLATAYVARLDLARLPAAAATAVRQSVFGGDTVARQLRSSSLTHSVHAAFVHGMDRSLTVSAGIAFAGVLLALIFVPRIKLPEHDDETAISKEVTTGAR
jgi:DHA2 family multidrug resistance protein-like MFS transporter